MLLQRIKAKIINFRLLCHTIIKAQKANRDIECLRYAAAYAREGLSFQREDEVDNQIPYILSNLSGWRGEEAQKVKKLLKELQDVK